MQMAGASSRPQSGLHAAPTPSPIGGRSFIDHAKLRILLAPVGDIDEADFARWCDFVRSFETIRLADLPASCTARQHAARHASGGAASPVLQTGEIHLSFVTSYDPDHAFLAPFNMHRQVLGVLGLATYSNHALNRHELEASPSALRELHPGALVHRVFGFDSGAKRPETVDLSSIKDIVAAKINAPQRTGSPLNPAAAEARPATADEAAPTAEPKAPASPDVSGFSAHRDGGLIIFPAVRKDGKDVRFYLKTLLAELVANILDALDHIVTGLEGTPLETPRETLDGITSSRNAATPTSQASASWLGKTGSAATGASLAAGMGAAANRASSLFTAFSSSGSSSTGATEAGTGTSTPTSSRPSSAIGGGSHPFDLASPGSKTASPTSESTRSKILAANANKKSAKRVTSAAATGPTGTGRLAKVRADLHLLSGNLWDALEGYSGALTALGKERALAGGQDAVWFASALEGFSVARVLVSRMGGSVLEKAPCFDLPWSTANAKEKEKDKERDKDGIARPYAKQSWGEIAEAYTIAVVIYSKCLAPPSVLLEPVRSVTNDSPRDYTHPLIHASACTQYARFLLAVWASGGWNGECFDQLVYGGVPPALAEEKPTSATYMAFTAISGIARHDIAAAASSALTHSIVALKATDQITLLGTLTAIFGCIGFSRREAHLLRQLQATIVALLAKAKRVQAQPATTASLPLQQHAHFESDVRELLGNMVAQTTFDSLGRGPEAVLVLAVQVCETYGIHVELDPLHGIPSFHILSRASEGLRSAYASPALGGEAWTAEGGSRPGVQAALLTAEELTHEAPYGWKEQQMALLKEAIAVAELLTDYVAMAFFGAILLRDFHALLDAEEQRDLIVGMQRAVQAARWAGAQDLTLKYWGPTEPLCSLELLALAPERLPYERDAKHVLAQPIATEAEGAAGTNNPIFMNLASTARASAKMTAVQDEPMYVMATLQNEFAVDLHIDAVKLVGDGAGFVAEESERISIPPLSFHTVRLSATAKEVGTVTIRGVTLMLAGGCTEEMTFLLPVYDEENVRERRTRAAEADDRRTRLKQCGLDARSAVLKQKAANAASEASNSRKAPSPKWIEVDVVAAQPLLAAHCGALSPLGGLDLLEGESQLIHVELENMHAGLAVNYVRVGCSDDASEAAQQALVDAALLPSDVHEIEWDLVHAPALARDTSDTRGDAVMIEPGATTALPIRVTAKAGCTQAVVRLEYAHLDREKLQQGVAGKVHVRTVELGFRITVHPAVVCSGLQIVPLRAVEAARLTRECLESVDSVPAHLRAFDSDPKPTPPTTPLTLGPGEVEAEEDEYCLVSIEVSNAHRDDVLVRFALDTGGLAPLQLYRVLRGGTSTRVVLPHARIELDTHAQSGGSGDLPAIPTIWTGTGARQFVVSKLQLSAAEEAELRATFWFRDALLKRLGGVWRSLPAHAGHVARGGRVPLRGLVSGGLHMQAADREALQKPRVQVQLTFNEGSDVGAEEFIHVHARLTNRTQRSVDPIVRLVPTSPGSTEVGQTDAQLLASMVLADGTLTAPRLGPIAKGEHNSYVWNVAFLSPGTFAFVVTVQEADQQPDSLALVSAVHTLTVHP